MPLYCFAYYNLNKVGWLFGLKYLIKFNYVINLIFIQDNK